MNAKLTKREQTRQKMVKAAGRSFRSNGYAGVGVDGLAKDAGVTSGAFYKHFGSKAVAFDVALESGLDEVVAAVPMFQEQARAGWVKAFADYYLGKLHRGDLECGCAMTSLSPEVVRFGPSVRAAYEKKMSVIVDLMARGLAGGLHEERRVRAWAMLGVLIGGLTMARAMKRVAAAEEVAEAIKAAAVKAAGRVRALPVAMG